jgi:hypothetical protein
VNRNRSKGGRSSLLSKTVSISKSHHIPEENQQWEKEAPSIRRVCKGTMRRMGLPQKKQLGAFEK